MPVVSEAQRRLFEASKGGEKWAQKKVDPSIAKEFLSATPDHAKLPEHKKKSKAERLYQKK